MGLLHRSGGSPEPPTINHLTVSRNLIYCTPICGASTPVDSSSQAPENPPKMASFGRFSSSNCQIWSRWAWDGFSLASLFGQRHNVFSEESCNISEILKVLTLKDKMSKFKTNEDASSSKKRPYEEELPEESSENSKTFMSSIQR